MINAIAIMFIYFYFISQGQKTRISYKVQFHLQSLGRKLHLTINIAIQITTQKEKSQYTSYKTSHNVTSILQNCKTLTKHKSI